MDKKLKLIEIDEMKEMLKKAEMEYKSVDMRHSILFIMICDKYRFYIKQFETGLLIVLSTSDNIHRKRIKTTKENLVNVLKDINVLVEKHRKVIYG